MHIVPRTRFYALQGEVPGGPEKEQVQDNRETNVVFVNGRSDWRIHNWKDSQFATKSMKSKWTGRRVFQKILATDAPPAPAAAEAEGRPLMTGLLGIRKKLGQDQRNDPELRAIIAHLKN